MDIILEILKESIQISLLVAVMMIAVDLLNMLTKQKLKSFFKNAL